MADPRTLQTESVIAGRVLLARFRAPSRPAFHQTGRMVTTNCFGFGMESR